MNSPPNPDHELDQLLMALVDGVLAPEQQQHLAALLRDDPRLQEKYLDYLLLDALLRWEQPERTSVPVPAVPTAGGETAEQAAEPPRPHRRFTSHLILGLAAGVLFALGAYTFHHWQRGDDNQNPTGPAGVAAEAAAEPTAGGLAVLTRSVGARWERGSPPLETGAPVPTGWLHLLAGVIQLEFYSGATVVVEGPARLELLATDRVRCWHGKLRASVPPPARGFTVLSARTELVDLGTEFGFQVAPDGATEVHVFRGLVELHDRGSQRSAAAKQEVAAGRGVKVDAAGQRTAIDVNEKAFLSSAELERQAAAAAAARYQNWLRHRDQLRRDPRLIVYYSFENRRPQQRLLQAENTDDESWHGAIIGCEWVAGRWPQKQALEFKRPSDRVRLYLPGEYTSLTFMAWVRVDGLDRYLQALLLTDGFDENEPHWQINRGGSLQLGVNSPPTPQNFLSPRVFGLADLGKWTHLATVHDGEAWSVTHYINGRAVSQGALAFAVPLRFGEVEIGNWGASVSGGEGAIRNFNGRMDEFLLFRQALGAQEVLELYRAGAPDAP